MENITPEGRLLRLIRGKSRKPPREKERKGLSFNFISRVLQRITLILGIYLLADLLIINSGNIEGKVLMLMGKGAAPEVPAQVAFRPVSHYTQPIKSRDIFTVGSSAAKRAQPSSVLKELASKLKLQGIISGVKPQAIIADTKSGQVYFLSPGERIGEIELKQILPGKVKLNYHGQEVELSL